MKNETDSHISDQKRRMLVNAQGAVNVVHANSESIDKRLEQIVDRAKSQSNEMEDVVEAVTSLSASVEKIAASATEASERSTRTAKRTTEGKQSATAAMESIEAVEAVIGDVASEVETLTSQIEKIESALAGINEIANQTNMLALNASIEAARAGEAGEGFAVVAEEVKSLAEQSQQQADEIDTLLAEISTSADATVEQLDTAKEEIHESTDEVSTAATNLGAVTEEVEKTAQDIKTISEMTDEQATVSETVTESCERAATQAEEITGSIATIHDARAEQTTMIEEIDSALSSATPSLAVEKIERIPTGSETLDAVTNGGLLLGGQSVLRYEGGTVDDVISQFCAGALDAGYAVSLMPTPTLDRSVLGETLAARGQSLDTALAEDRLFVLDAFGHWQTARNIFDLHTQPLEEINRQTATRRESPLLIIGNIAGEISVLGEETARAARYENDASVFDPADTVCNVIDDETVDSTFAAFYDGGADQVLRVTGADEDRTVELVHSPAGSTPPRRLDGVSTGEPKPSAND